MSSSACRAQTEPLAALVAVSVFVAALGLYVVAFDAVPVEDDRDLEQRALATVVERSSTGGVISPTDITAEPPNGYEMAVLVRADGSVWRTGVHPENATSASMPALVSTETGERVGRVRVWIWR